MNRFWEFMGDVRSVGSWIAKAAIAAPLTDLVLQVGPPWPYRYAVGIVTACIVMMVLMWSFQHWSKIAKRRREQRMTVSLAAMICCAGIYVLLFASCTYRDYSDKKEPIRATGLVYREPVRALLYEGSRRDGPPSPPDGAGSAAGPPATGHEAVSSENLPDDGPGRRYTVDELLEMANWNAADVWEPWSIIAARIALLLTWVAMFACLASFVSLFVLLQPPSPLPAAARRPAEGVPGQEMAHRKAPD